MKRRIVRGLLGLVAALALLIAGFLYLLLARVDGQFFDSAGVPLHYTVEGKGDPVILVHGLAANADLNWRRAGINRALAGKYQVIAFDLRGHGLSGRPHEPDKYGIEMVEDIARLMDHLKIDKAHFAGYSLGGFIVTKFAARYPERTRSLAICASGWKDPDDPEPIRNPYKDPPDERLAPDHKKHEQLKKFVNKSAPPRQASILPAFLPAATAQAQQQPPAAKWVKDFLSDFVVDREAMRALKKSLGMLSVPRDELAQMQTPTICFIGTNDGLKPYAMDLKTVRPDVELIIIPGADHITTAIRSEFRKGLLNFFNTHP